MPTPKASRAPRSLAALTAAVALLVLSACSGAPEQRLTPVASAVETGVPYWTGEGTTLRLDACRPRDDSPIHPAVVILHGGGFTSGSRDEPGSRAVCTSLARSGVVGFSIDYRLLPAVYPAQVQDVQHAIEWLRRPAQAARFGIDPKRIALLGSSAGAIIAQEAATAGTGRRGTGTRVSAVVSLSGVSLMTPKAEELGSASPQAENLVLGYLGCASKTPATCPSAAKASAMLQVDRTDPPMLLVNGSDELVPSQQATTMGATLKLAGIPVQTVIVQGSDHGLALLDGPVRADVQAFLKKHL